MRKLNMVFLLMCIYMILPGTTIVLHAQNFCPNGNFELTRPISESTNPNIIPGYRALPVLTPELFHTL